MLRDLTAVDDVVGFLDRAEAGAGGPLVDEAERARLQQIATGAQAPDRHWHPVVARRGGEIAGYAGVVEPEEAHAAAATDLAVARDGPAATKPVLEVLLAAIEALSRRHGAGRVRAWLRHATAADVRTAADLGYGIGRRLAVLGRSLDPDPPAPDIPAGMRLRAYRPGSDDGAVVNLLADAYADTAEDRWDRAELASRRDYPWFQAEDLLLLEHDDGTLAGLHWTKRRGDGVGEVYNLAVDPDEQGRGFGAVLLRAGLAHLAAIGCTEVVLWVDLGNERGVRLYASHGFHLRWEDITLTRTLTADAGA